MRPKYILLAERIASHNEAEDRVVQPGSLWQLLNDEPADQKENVLTLTSLEFDNIQMKCPAEEVANISEQEYNLLVAIDATAQRHHIYSERELLREGTNLSVGDVVYVLNGDGALHDCPERIVGKIRYKGMVSGLKGEWIGIELSVVSNVTALLMHDMIFME